MTRDDDYLRKLLFEAEASDTPYLLAVELLAPDPDDLKRHTHAVLLKDAGLFAEVSKDVFRLTSQGHDYLATIRDEGVWKRTKEVAAKAGGATLSTMVKIAVTLAEEEVSLRLKGMGFGS